MGLILIVEDEFVIAQDIKEILESEGHNCITHVNSYELAVDIINESKPDLVLIDIILNTTQDGLKIAAYLYDMKTIPYVFITSLYDKNTILNIKQTNPYGYIVKPFKPIDVKTCVELALHNFKHLKIDVNRVNVPEINDDTPFQIRKVVAHINNNISEKIQIEDLIMLTRWKRNHFTMMFKKYMNIPPHQYILKAKIERCMALLSTTNQSAVDIAFDLGFNSYSSFSKIFKKVTGMTIEEFKKKNRISKSMTNNFN